MDLVRNASAHQEAPAESPSNKPPGVHEARDQRHIQTVSQTITQGIFSDDAQPERISFA